MRISKKVILIKKELYNLIIQVYEKGFDYGTNYTEIFNKYGNSQGKDTITYSQNKLKEILK